MLVTCPLPTQQPLKIATSIFQFKTIGILLFLSLFVLPKAQAVAVSTTKNYQTTISQKPLSQKKERKIRRWQKRLSKWMKKQKNKKGKMKFGLIGCLILAGGVLSLVVFDGLFLLALLASMVLGILGLIKDEKKLLALIALLAPLVFFLFLTIALIRIFGS
ncbi:MAG: hypothetical protein AAFV95_28185 [Bacteroidota bacterium]